MSRTGRFQSISNSSRFERAQLKVTSSMENCEAYNPVASSVSIGSDDESIEWSESSKPDTDLYIIRLKNYEASDCWGSYELSVKGLD